MKKGFATSAILYTMLLLFIVLMVGILNNLQNKKVILDALKQDTIFALEQDTVLDVILDQIGALNTHFADLEERVKKLEDHVYTKEEADQMSYLTKLKLHVVATQAELDAILNPFDRYQTGYCTKEGIYVNKSGLSLLGGMWIVETCKASSIAGYQIAKVYSDPSIITRERSYINKWNSWVNPHA